MPITRVPTRPTLLQASASDPSADTLSPEVKSQLYAFIEAFLVLNPSPEDVQVHALAASVNMEKETFEEVMYEILAEVIQSSTALRASDADGKAMENDGFPDEEQLGDPDEMKEAGDTDGAIDTEQLDELQGN
jgi:hypothetical protein